ncbi:MAG: GtrA family protein [Halioglobus sp.]|nr:GtrA family protein [Halioglobus sp.]
MRIALNYTLCAIIATLANISSQELSLRIYESAYSVTVSVLVGTAVGLIVKYVLDKRYIFRFQADDALHDTHTFAIYTLMGVFTTVIFWGFEFGFHYLFETRHMRYLGGVLGLAIGYYLKYQLDKRFVFVARSHA